VSLDASAASGGGHEAFASDVELEGQRGVGRDGTRREYLADQVSEAQGHGEAVAKFGGVEVQLRQRHHVPHDLLDVGRAPPNFHGQRIRHLASRVGAQARNVAPGPEIAGSLGCHDGGPAQHGVGAVTEGFDVRVVADLNADEFRRLWHGAGESGPFAGVEVRLAVDEELRGGGP
jgi:hypothetical protein